jgi:hypothetical protein
MLCWLVLPVWCGVAVTVAAGFTRVGFAVGTSAMWLCVFAYVWLQQLLRLVA